MAVSINTIVPSEEPATVGVKVTVIVHVSSGVRVAGQSLAWVNGAPLAVMEVKSRSTVPELVKVMVQVEGAEEAH